MSGIVRRVFYVSDHRILARPATKTRNSAAKRNNGKISQFDKVQNENDNIVRTYGSVNIENLDKHLISTISPPPPPLGVEIKSRGIRRM